MDIIPFRVLPDVNAILNFTIVVGLVFSPVREIGRCSVSPYVGAFWFDVAKAKPSL